MKEITFPATVTDIGAYAFYGCEKLEKIVFAAGSKLTALGGDDAPADRPYWGKHLFAGSVSLKSIQLPENLTTIGPGCFENSAIEKINLPMSVDTIGAAAFKNCDNLVEMKLSPAMIYIGDEAFFDCDKLEKADLSFGLEYLGSMAFAYCEQLKTAYIPATVANIPGNPFTGCAGVTSFTLDQDNTDFVVEDGVLYDKTMYTLLYYPASLTAETFQFPASVQEIAPGAFASAQLKTMVIPSRITQIPDSAFRGSALESITFHPGVTSIGDYAFEGCKNLNNVTMLSSIKYAGNYAFANCTALRDFVFEDMPDGADPYVIGQHFFDGCTAMTQLCLPNRMTITDEEAAIYRDSATFVSNLKNINAVIPGYMFANTGIVNAVVPARITDIHTIGVFYGCKQLQSVTFEAGTLDTKSIGNYYFSGCTNLKEIELRLNTSTPFYSSIQNGRSGAFAGCTSLEKVTVYTSSSKATGVNSDYDVFRNCVSLKKVEIYNKKNVEVGFRYISDGTFYGCTSLTVLPIMGNNSYVEGTPFAGTGLEVLHFATAKYFRSGANFAGMKNLKSVFFKQTGIQFYADSFTNLESEVNFYFYNMTYEEMVKAAGNDDWYTNADKKAHFYFKDTMPEGVEIPA